MQFALLDAGLLSVQVLSVSFLVSLSPSHPGPSQNASNPEFNRVKMDAFCEGGFGFTEARSGIYQITCEKLEQPELHWTNSSHPS